MRSGVKAALASSAVLKESKRGTESWQPCTTTAPDANQAAMRLTGATGWYSASCCEGPLAFVRAAESLRSLPATAGAAHRPDYCQSLSCNYAPSRASGPHTSGRFLNSRDPKSTARLFVVPPSLRSGLRQADAGGLLALAQSYWSGLESCAYKTLSLPSCSLSLSFQPHPRPSPLPLPFPSACSFTLQDARFRSHSYGSRCFGSR